MVKIRRTKIEEERLFPFLISKVEMSSPKLSRRQSSLIRTRCRESLHRLSSNSSLFSNGEGNGPTKIIGLNGMSHDGLSSCDNCHI